MMTCKTISHTIKRPLRICLLMKCTIITCGPYGYYFDLQKYKKNIENNCFLLSSFISEANGQKTCKIYAFGFRTCHLSTLNYNYCRKQVSWAGNATIKIQKP